jgi:predicted dienelactone hydrolase
MLNFKSTSTLMVAFVLFTALSLNIQAQSDETPTYGLRGVHSVGVVDFIIEQDDNNLNATMWYPALNSNEVEDDYTYDLNGLVTAGQAIHDALPDIGDEPYPLIIYSHGLFGSRFESTHYLEHLASWGFVVIAADHNGSTFFDTTSADDIVQSFGYRPQDITRLIDYAEAINAEGEFTGLLDMNAIGVTGFSFGGYTALRAGGAVIDSAALAIACEGVSTEQNALCDPSYQQLLAETIGLDAIPQGLWESAIDERIKAIVPLAPCCVDILGADGLASGTIPLMVIIGTADTAAPPEQNGIVAFDNVSSETSALVLIEDAGHDIYVDSYNGAIVRAHELIRHFSTAFFMAQLKDDISAATRLDPSTMDFAEITYTTVGINPE